MISTHYSNRKTAAAVKELILHPLPLGQKLLLLVDGGLFEFVVAITSTAAAWLSQCTYQSPTPSLI